jgi:hypothetical protein
MTARKIDFYLGTLRLTPEHQRLFSHVEKLTEMQRVFTKIMPPNLGSHCALGGLSEGSLTICANNGAIAAKLRHMLPSLLLKLQAVGYEVTAIRIAVQANYRDIPGNDLSGRKREIDKGGIKSLHVLAAGLENSPLKTAVESLLGKQKRKF